MNLGPVGGAGADRRACRDPGHGIQGAPLPHGEETAVPNDGYLFDAWAVDGIEQEGNDPSCRLTMDANRAINAIFARIEQP
ncbi:hypothetical protein [Streptomyces sp. NPDC002467]|uniref:InlB B-repeat-containing protein n=1 Tax=Streptomyces sp. NPDC002467 TaxID=3364647 RepID=UPI0036B73A82